MNAQQIKSEILARPNYSDLNIIQKINMKGNAESYGKYWTDNSEYQFGIIRMNTIAARYDGLIEWNKKLHHGYRY